MATTPKDPVVPTGIEREVADAAPIQRRIANQLRSEGMSQRMVSEGMAKVAARVSADEVIVSRIAKIVREESSAAQHGAAPAPISLAPVPSAAHATLAPAPTRSFDQLSSDTSPLKKSDPPAQYHLTTSGEATLQPALVPPTAVSSAPFPADQQPLAHPSTTNAAAAPSTIPEADAARPAPAVAVAAEDYEEFVNIFSGAFHRISSGESASPTGHNNGRNGRHAPHTYINVETQTTPPNAAAGAVAPLATAAAGCQTVAVSAPSSFVGVLARVGRAVGGVFTAIVAAVARTPVGSVIVPPVSSAVRAVAALAHPPRDESRSGLFVAGSVLLAVSLVWGVARRTQVGALACGAAHALRAFFFAE